MCPEFDAFSRGPTEARPATAEQEPGANIVLGCVRRGEFAIHAEPILPVINDAVVETVHVRSDAGQFIETQEGVAAVDLPGIIFENAGAVLRRCGGGGPQPQGEGGGGGETARGG